MVYFSIGKTLLEFGKVDEAIKELSRSFTINEDLRNERGVVIVSSRLIPALLKLGSYNDALEFYNRASKITRNNSQLIYLKDKYFSEKKSRLTTGIVKRVIKHQKGYIYGFITSKNEFTDIYFREGYVEVDDISKLSPGINVEVEFEQGAKGLHANRIKLL